MSSWTVNFSNQRILETLKESAALLSSLALPTEISSDARDNFLRLQKVTQALASRFEAIDPDLLSSEIINSIGPEAAALLANLQAYLSNTSYSHIDSANMHADRIVSYSRAITATPVLSDVGAIIATAANFNQQSSALILEAKNKVLELNAQFEPLRAKLAETVSTVDAQKSRLDQAIEIIQKQVSTAENQRSIEHLEALKAINQDALDQQKRRADEFKLEAEAREKVFETIETSRRSVEDEHLVYLARKRTEVDEIFGAIGSSTRAGHFLNSANVDAAAANELRRTALWLMMAMVIAASATYIHSLYSPTLDWKLFGFRLGTTIIFAIPAVYAAQESSKHRQKERQARKLFLELASIDAYLSLLPKLKQDEIKEKFTEKFFGREEPIEKEEKISKHALLKMLERMVRSATRHRM
jgi:hypothetical protein